MDFRENYFYSIGTALFYWLIYKQGRMAPAYYLVQKEAWQRSKNTSAVRAVGQS